MAHAFVTGAAGFIGSHLARHLINAGERVTGLDNFDPFYSRQLKQFNLDPIASSDPASRENFEFIEGDICDTESVSGAIRRVKPDIVYHIAALAGVRPSIQQPQRYARVNIDGLANVLEAAREAGCNKIVFASSSSVYGNNAKIPFAETDRVDEPISPYAATKASGELLCRVHAHLHGASVVVLRFFTVFGPAQRPDLAISYFMRLIANDEEVPMFGDGSTSRDYTFIDDIIGGVLAAGERVQQAEPGFFRIYNLGGSHPVSLRTMIDSVGEVIGRTPRIKPLPMQPGDVERTWADLTRSSDELGYQPRTEFRAGLEQQWQWLRDHALDVPVEAGQG